MFYWNRWVEGNTRVSAENSAPAACSMSESPRSCTTPATQLSLSTGLTNYRSTLARQSLCHCYRSKDRRRGRVARALLIVAARSFSVQCPSTHSSLSQAMHRRRSPPALFLLLVSSIPLVLGWGAVGHEIVATIAQIHLQDHARETLRDLLPYSSGHLAPIASWADRIRGIPAYRE